MVAAENKGGGTLSPSRLAYWEGRLYNWALYLTGADSCGNGSATDGTFGGDVTRPPQPLVGEALDTDMLVKRLPGDEQAALRAWYVWTGTIDDRAKTMGIHRNTLHNRVDRAQVRLEDLYWSRPRPM